MTLTVAAPDKDTSIGPHKEAPAALLLELRFCSDIHHTHRNTETHTQTHTHTGTNTYTHRNGHARTPLDE